MIKEKVSFFMALILKFKNQIYGEMMKILKGDFNSYQQWNC